MKSPSICLVIVYFGKWPQYFNYFLKGCSTNPTIDLIFFTDNDSIDYEHENVKLVPFSFQEFNALASSKLQQKVNVSKAYKLCDFKSIYGKIFEEYLERYSFWGYCDIDVVFGNIRKLITNEMLDQYDIISPRKEYMCGHLSLFRNAKKTNELFRKSADYERIVTESSHCYSFDECGGLWRELLSGRSIWGHNSDLDSMTHVIKREEKNGNITTYFETLVSEPTQHKSNTLAMERYTEELIWDHGTLINLKTKMELLHFHANVLKNWKHFNVPSKVKIPDTFYINERGFTVHPFKKLLKTLTHYTLT